MKRIFILVIGFLLIAVNLYAAGDLIVEGNVGIGTTTPWSALHIARNNTDSRLLLIFDNTTSPGYADWSFGRSGDDNDLTLYNWWNTDPNTDGPRVTFTSDGNVGIGTTNPSAKLEVAGNAGTDGIKLPDGTLMTTAQGYLLLNVVMTAYTTNTTSLSWVIDVGDSILDWDSIISAGYKEARIVTQMWMSATGSTGYLQMYDKTNAAVVTEFGELTVTDTSSTIIKTSNWVNITSKTGLVNIGFQKKVTGGTCYYRNTSLQFRR